MKKQRRKLSIITQDLRIALKRETTDIIGIGDLLVEARYHLKHGKWLPWLKQEFSLSDRSARNYMQAAKFAAKSETVSDLGNLSPSALYAISSDSGFYTPEIIKVILQEAKKNRVGKDRAGGNDGAALQIASHGDGSGGIDPEQAGAIGAAAQDGSANRDHGRG